MNAHIVIKSNCVGQLSLWEVDDAGQWRKIEDGPLAHLQRRAQELFPDAEKYVWDERGLRRFGVVFA